jgi:hypothetical protein
MAPISLRLDKEIHMLLSQGRRRTPLKKQELIRRTLRSYLPRVIEQESRRTEQRVTNISPWPKGTLARAYQRLTKLDKEWGRIEQAGVKAQGTPSWDD